MSSTPQRVRYVSARDAAARCGVSERTVRRWIASGQLQADKRGQSFRIPLEALEQHVHNDSGHAADSCGEADTVAAFLPENRDTPQQISEAGHLATLLRETQAELVQKSEAAAMWQARAEMLASEIGRMKALEATPAESAPAVPDPVAQPQRPWWRFWP